MNNKILIWILLTILFSCKTENKEYGIHKELYEILSKQKPNDEYIDEIGIFLFSKTNEDNRVGYLTDYDLQRDYIYKKRFKSISYEDFVSKVITQDIIFNCSELYSCFVPNDTIIYSFTHDSFTDFLKTYTDKTDSEKYYIIKNKNLSYNKIITIVYCLYLKGYYSCYDDYMGVYRSGKLDKFLENESIEEKGFYID